MLHNASQAFQAQKIFWGTLVQSQNQYKSPVQWTEQTPQNNSGMEKPNAECYLEWDSLVSSTKYFYPFSNIVTLFHHIYEILLLAL